MAIKEIENSLSRRSLVTSICKSPKKPQRKPNPRARDVSGSNVKAASFSFNLAKAFLNSSNSLVSIGYSPQ